MYNIPLPWDLEVCAAYTSYNYPIFLEDFAWLWIVKNLTFPSLLYFWLKIIDDDGTILISGSATSRQLSLLCFQIDLSDGEEDGEDDDDDDDGGDDDDKKYKGVNERSLHSFHRQSNSPGREIPFDTRPSSCFAE